MGDILSAASLLLTIVTVLYALWYPELSEAIKTEVPIHSQDRPGPLAYVKKILWSRAVPLFFSSLVVSIIFIPDAINIVNEVFHLYKRNIYKYNSVKTAICVVVVFSVGITFHLANVLWKIVKKYSKLKN